MRCEEGNKGGMINWMIISDVLGGGVLNIMKGDILLR